jgi:hypothetical protein
MVRKKSARLALLSPNMRAHISQIGGALDYARWCRNNSLPFLADKSPQEIEAEHSLWAEQQSRRSARPYRSPEKLLEDICLGRGYSGDPRNTDWPKVVRVIEATPDDRESRESLLEFLLKVRKASPRLMVENAVFGPRQFPCIRALCQLNERRHQWLRKLDDWQAPDNKWEFRFIWPDAKWRQDLASLIRHLLVDHPVPLFMDQAWLRTGKSAELFQEWHLHLGSGKDIGSIRLPIPLTPAMAKEMMQAPGDCMIESALLWGQIRGLGGGRELAEAIVGSRTGMVLSHNGFWVSVFRFLIDHPDFDQSKIRLLLHFLWTQKFARTKGYDRDGRRLISPPPQPDLVMEGLTADWLSAQIDAQNREVDAKWPHIPSLWPRSAFQGLEIREGASVWKVVELLSHAEVREEARQLKNGGVLSSAIRARKRSFSLWSLRRETQFGTQRRATITVSHDGKILSASGKRGYIPAWSDFSILRSWAEHAGLDIEPLL